MKHKGVHLPDHETHLQRMIDISPEINGKPTYQWKKLAECLKVCREGNAIDIGGHCGLWSMHMVDYFDHVFAFEPIREHRDCFRRNVKGEYTLFPLGCGDERKSAGIHTSEGSSGDSWVTDGDDIDIVRIDDLSLPNISFLKVDTEGYEYFALKGAEKTILEHRPTIIVEQKRDHCEKFGLKRQQAVRYLESLGMKEHMVISGDHIMVWDTVTSFS